MKFLLVAGIAAAVYAAIYYAVSRLMYRPTRYPGGWWHLQAELGAQDVWLLTSDGVRLHGWWMEARGSPLVTLYFKGNGTNVSVRPGHLRQIVAAGSSVLILDYRGYGKSAGRPTEQGLYRDADAGYDYLIAAGYSAGQIVLLGESLGSAVAVDLATRRPCAGVILECPFTSFSALAGMVVPWIGGLFASGFNTRGKIGSIHAPLLIIHGDQDPTVPYRMGKELFAAAKKPKSLWTIEGASHMDIVSVGGAGYLAQLRGFYADVMRPASQDDEALGG